MTRTLVTFTALAGALALAPDAAAQQVTINFNTDITDQYGLDTTQLENDMNAALSDQLKIGDQTDFMNGMANAAVISVKGLGVDYATNFNKFMIGGGLGTGVYGSGASFNKGDALLPEAGFSFQAAVMAGINLGMFGDSEEDNFADRVRIYANGLLLEDMGDDAFGGSFTNAGAHLQFKLIKRRQGQKLALLEWGGLDVTTGYEYTSYGLSLREALPIETATGDTGTLGWDATGSYDIDIMSNTIPVELSTNLRIFVVNAFGGVAYDYNYGDADTVASLSGPLTLSNDYIGEEQVGSASVSLSGDGSADPNFGRVFGGVQIDVFMLHVYGQVNYALNSSFGGHFGARLAI